MHRFLSFIAATAVLLMLGACASSGSRRDTAAAVDTGKVVAVDQWAKRKHATVMWVHYPQTAATVSPAAQDQ
jgi:hypothetical protein